ncbi:MAG: FAD/NAD(P)-binding oxidoreductase [Hyphomicrobiaceae bacterium]|nr:NAD(P)/FAD-dependent oxidoreductase [Hyphomicrobiaceae bacterium]
MTKRLFSRRDFAKLISAAGAATLSPGSSRAQAPNINRGARPHVVIIGGGAGGGTLAHLLRRGTPEIDVTLIEAQKQYTSCFFSNLYFSGFRTLESLTHDYGGLESVGTKMIYDRATAIDASKKFVSTQSGGRISYDRLVVSPGIDFKYESIPGYGEAGGLGEQAMPHAYKAGAQTKLLMDQLVAMRDGGVVVLAPPQNPYRCPPGPYERACMIANYLKDNKPKSKLIIVDPKRNFSKQQLFMQAFANYYPGIVEVHLSTEIDDQSIKRVDPKTMEIETVAGKKIKADVANIIPAQRAGTIVRSAMLNEGDWCPINAETFGSTKASDIFIVGDASIAGEMPKSAFSANSQAKAVSNFLEAELADKPRYPARYRNTCWSMLGPEASVKIGASYAAKDGKVVAVNTFVSKTDEDDRTREKSFKESRGWYAGIVAEAFNRRVQNI